MIEKIKELDTPGTSDKCLDAMFKWVNSLCYAGSWDEINETLRSMDVEEWSAGALVGFLSIARPASPHLVDGVSFFGRVKEKFLRDEGEKRTSALTGGLQFEKFTTDHCGHPRCPTCKERK